MMPQRARTLSAFEQVDHLWSKILTTTLNFIASKQNG
jgi:hypothetical protein